MRRGFALLAAPLFVVATSSARLASAADPAPPPPRPAYMVGDPVEDFSLKVVGGGEFKLSEARKIDDATAWASVAAAAKEVYGADLKLPLALLIIFIVLLVRPAGLFGKPVTRRV